MAPSRSKALKPIIGDEVHELPSRQQTITIQSPVTTPNQSSSKMVIGITQAQKQALIDNLQLEITERARKLRAQYTLQAQGLRNRIELRINRIPKSLRTANMGELFSKYQEIKNAPSKASALLGKPPSQENVAEPIAEPYSTQTQAQILKDATKVASVRVGGIKRKSDDLENWDKENAPDPMQTIPNPKKRTKALTGATTQNLPTQSTVLSPKSSNSRTLPHSPIHPLTGSPQKAFVSCQPSPLKPVVIIDSSLPGRSAATVAANQASVMSEKPKPARGKAATTRKASNLTVKPKPTVSRSKQGARNATAQSRSVSSTSHTSNTSTGTTIMRNEAKSTTITTAAAGKKRNLNVGGRAGKKAAAPVEAPPAGRRVLRKRA